jgi:hypothetical protein
MPLQNRVTPFGEIVAIPERGLFTGNRGIIHDPATKTLLKKRWTTKAWIVCACVYKDHHREVMGKQSWTELFFLDEATALAAGHRPCFFCRRAAAQAFQSAWAAGNGGGTVSAPEIDAVLHRQRLQGRAKRIHPLPSPIEDLPDGTMIAAGGDAVAIVAGWPFLWSAEGYRPAGRLSDLQGLLTPPATVKALGNGYRPVLHPSLVNV